MQDLLEDIKQCTICSTHLVLGTRPIVSAHPESKIVIIGQAPEQKCMLQEFLGMMQAVGNCENG